MPTLDGWLALDGSLRRGRVRFGRHLDAVEVEGEPRRDAPPDDDAPRILPGFVDTHVHGGGGGDTMDGPDGIRALARHHLAHGSTTLLPTTITQTWPQVLAALDAVAQVRADGGDDLPDLPGAHLEGPFLSPDRLGAQPPHAIAPDTARVAEVVAKAVVRVVTIAPELPGALDAARAFARSGVRVSVGHTRADAEAAQALVAAVREARGTPGFTHLFNAMGGVEGRAPGPAGAALADPEAFAELILDGHHVHPVAFRAALAAKPDRLHLVTDAIRASGLPEGPTELGGQAVRVEGGAARLPDGTLAGSVLTMDAAVRNAVRAGVSLGVASRLASGTPARYLGLNDRGRLEAGARADLVVLDPELQVRAIYRAGRAVPLAAPTADRGVAR